MGGFSRAELAYTELTDMQSNAAGEIRQIGVYKDAVWAQADTTTLVQHRSGK